MGWFSKLFRKVFSWIVVIVAIVVVVIATVITCGAALAAMSGFLAAGLEGLASATFLGMSLGQCMLIGMVAGFSAICLLHIAMGLVGGATETLTMADPSTTEVEAQDTFAYEPTGAGTFVQRLSVTDDTITEVEFVLGRKGDDDVVISSEVEDGLYAGWLSAQAVALAAQADLLVRTGQSEELRASLVTTISELEASETALAATIRELEAAEQDSAAARSELQSVQQHLAEARDLEAQLRAANAAVHAQLDAASERETALLAQLSASRADALSLGEALAALSDELSTQAAENEELTAQLAELVARNQTYRDALAQLDAESIASQESWSAALIAQQRLTSEAQASAAALTERLAQLQAEFDATDAADRAERMRLQEQIDTLNDALTSATELRVAAERGLEYANSELVSLRSLAQSLAIQLEESDQTALVAELRAAVASYDQLLTEAKAELHAKDEFSQVLASKLSAATDRIAKLMAQAELSQQATQLLSNQVNAAAQAAATYQATLAQRDMENAVLRDYIDHLSTQLARLSETTTRTNKPNQEHDKGAAAVAAIATLALAATVLDE